VRPSKLIALVAALLFGAAPIYGNPQRVVSLNLCTDQLLMLLADGDQIASLSKIATDPRTSPMAQRAQGFAINSGDAEEIFMQAPDLVLAGTYTEQGTVQMLRSLGITVEIFAPEQNFDDIRQNIARMGQLLGHPQRADTMLRDFDDRLAQLTHGITQRPRAALYSANGYTTGAETMAGHILSAAGFDNIAAEAGISWGGTLPLETLVMLQPDLVITGSTYPGHSRSEEILRHPALTPLKSITQTGAKWVCGTPAVLDAVADLQRAHPDKGAK